MELHQELLMSKDNKGTISRNTHVSELVGADKQDRLESFQLEDLRL